MISTRNDSTIRQYRPAIGKLIKLSEWSDYTSRGLSPWGWLRVTGIDKDTVTVRHAPHPTDPSHDEPEITIPLYAVATPIGWEPRYAIHAQGRDGADNVVNNWFSRGIVVRQSHDMGGSMPTAFQPLVDGELPGSPHWQYPEVTDVIQPEDCKRLFRVVAVEEEEITSATLGYPADPKCTSCQGTGRRTIAQLAEVRNETVEQLWALIDKGQIPLDDLTHAAEHSAFETFRCHCAQHGAMSRLTKTERTKLIKEMRAEGWQVEYRPYAGGFWERRKEILVHDWESA
jgi:hypothetical protein